MLNKSVKVEIDSVEAELIYESRGVSHLLYIPGYLTLINTDNDPQSHEEVEQEFEDITNDVKNGRISIVKYEFLGHVVYDFKVTNSKAWDNYPRSISVGLALARLFGKRIDCGKLILSDNNS